MYHNVPIRLIGQPDHQSISNRSVHLSLRRSPRSPSFPTASKTGVPDTPSILAFQRCPWHFLCILYQSVGRFPELTPVRSQTTSRGFLPWMPVTLYVVYKQSWSILEPQVKSSGRTPSL